MTVGTYASIVVPVADPVALRIPPEIRFNSLYRYALNARSTLRTGAESLNFAL
jgi:hypothetical protein